MSLAQMIDQEALYLDGVITLKYRHPVCSVCGRQRPQSEWRFVWVHHMTCHECIARREAMRDEV